MSKKEAPSMDAWIKEAKSDPAAGECGMYLFHCGIVRQTARAAAREGRGGVPAVRGMEFSHDAAKAEAARQKTLDMPGIKYARVWLNEGKLALGDDIMRVLIGGDIRPHVVDALQFLVGELKTNCVTEKEKF